jgi:Formamidopyrimidine-DNA glycosylase
MQSGFSGIGNWMADEILWRARILPSKRAGRLNADERDQVLRATKFVARESLRIIGPDDSKLPRSWLIHQRWEAGGKCPRHKTHCAVRQLGGGLPPGARGAKDRRRTGLCRIAEGIVSGI